MREWATVVSWHNGIATLHSDIKTSCNRCAARKGCGSHLLNQIGPKNAHVIEIHCTNRLQPGQRVELGIDEKNLLGSAMLVYTAPLAGLFIVASFFYMWFATDLAAVSGALLGGTVGFLLAKGISAYIGSHHHFQPKIITVTPPFTTLYPEDDDT